MSPFDSLANRIWFLANHSPIWRIQMLKFATTKHSEKNKKQMRSKMRIGVAVCSKSKQKNDIVIFRGITSNATSPFVRLWNLMCSSTEFLASHSVAIINQMNRKAVPKPYWRNETERVIVFHVPWILLIQYMPPTSANMLEFVPNTRSKRLVQIRWAIRRTSIREITSTRTPCKIYLMNENK